MTIFRDFSVITGHNGGHRQYKESFKLNIDLIFEISAMKILGIDIHMSIFSSETKSITVAVKI